MGGTVPGEAVAALLPCWSVAAPTRLSVTEPEQKLRMYRRVYYSFFFFFFCIIVLNKESPCEGLCLLDPEHIVSMLWKTVHRCKGRIWYLG